MKVELIERSENRFVVCDTNKHQLTGTELRVSFPMYGDVPNVTWVVLKRQEGSMYWSIADADEDFYPEKWVTIGYTDPIEALDISISAPRSVLPDRTDNWRHIFCKHATANGIVRCDRSDELVIRTQYSAPHSDGCADYKIRTKNITLKEAIDYIVSTYKEEWGVISILDGSVYEKRHCLEYDRGEIVHDYFTSKEKELIVSGGMANGGWSLMNYDLTVWTND